MKNSKLNIFSNLQVLGKSLMVPVSVLPAAGLLVAIGRLLQSGNGKILILLGNIFFSGGLAIFEQLPLIFAIGVAIGFAQGAGVAALASAAGYFTLINVLKVMKEFLHMSVDINLGVFGGIIIGYLAAKTYERYHKTTLHPVLGFFSGKRLVPILTVGFSVFCALILSLVWPPLQNFINHMGMLLMNSTLGPAFYAAGKRLLIPLGLHHVYYPPFLFQFGEFVTSAGQVVHGESARYFAGDPTAGRFMASEYPIMLFGLPAAALAMYRRAPKEKRAMIGGVMLSAALTSILTGITEPIEFSFIFVAPILYVIHVVFAFGSGLLTNLLDIHLGYTFSASLIDYVLGFFNEKNGLLLFLIAGPIAFISYYGIFSFLIEKLNLKTPGRDLDFELANEEKSREDLLNDPQSEAAKILNALGGDDNLLRVDACITRLRVQVKDGTKVDERSLKNLGAAGVLKASGGNFQIVFGTRSEMLREDIESLRHQLKSASTPLQHKLLSPMRGVVKNLSEVPDETFQNKILGDGVAILPEQGVLYSPVMGKVVTLFKTGHAIGLSTDDGVEILIHLGIDTVKMKGQGFHPKVKVGDHVKIGDVLIEFDRDLILKEAKSLLSPIIITSTHQGNLQFKKWGNTLVGDELLEWQ